MGSDPDKPADFQRIDPDDYIDYEDHFADISEGGGKSSGSGKGKKTLKAIKTQAVRASERGRRAALEEKLRRFLRAFERGDPARLVQYLNWVNQNLAGELTLDPDQVEISFARSGGPGGQNVNKRETKVNAVHGPTGIQVSADQTRRQLENRQLALAELESRLADHLADWRSYLGPGEALTPELFAELFETRGS